MLGRLSSNQGRHSAAEVPDEGVEVVSSKQVEHPNEARQASGIKAVRPQVTPTESGLDSIALQAFDAIVELRAAQPFSPSPKVE